MKKIKYKICFLSWHFPTNKIMLDFYSRMTPGRSGKWKNIEAITNPLEADFIIVMGGSKDVFPKERALYFGAHGTCSPAFKDFKNVECLASFPLDKYLNPGEIWIDYDYDELVKLQPLKKTKNLCCITTYQTHRKTYGDRIRFLESLVPYYSKCNIYGRPSSLFKANPALKDHYKGFLGRDDHKMSIGTYVSGKNILLDYRYSLEFDQGKTINYICERFYDAMLLWCMPIYFGSTNVEEFFPIDSFRYVDISKDDLTEEVNKVIKLVGSDFREQHIPEMTIARDLMLNRFQVFAYVHEIINNLDKYIKEK